MTPSACGSAMGRAVAVEVGEDVQAGGEVGGRRRGARRCGRRRGRGRRGWASWPCRRRRWSRSAPEADWPPSVSQRPGSARAEVGAPDAGDRRGARGEGHQAGGGAGDQREVALDLRGAGEVAEDAEGAGVGVDEAGGDAGGGGEAEVARRPAGVSGPRSVATGVAVGGQAGAGEEVGEADGGEEVRRPAGGLVGEVAPLAGEGAVRAGGVAGGAPGRGSRRGRRRGRARDQVAGRWRFSHISFGICISGDMAPPAWSSDAGGRWRCSPSASAVARWSSQSMVSQRSSPVGRDGDRGGRRRRGGRASRWRRRRGRRSCSGRAAASARAARRAARRPARSGRESCSAWPASGAWVSMRVLGAAEQAAGGVEDAGAGAAGADVDGGDQRHLRARGEPSVRGIGVMPAWLLRRRSRATARGDGRARRRRSRPRSAATGRQGAHVVDDRVGRERGDAGAVLVGRCMAPPGEGHHPHAGGLRRHDAGRAVLDDQAGGGSIAEGPRRRARRGRGRACRGRPWWRRRRGPAKRGQRPVTVERELDALGLRGGGDAEGAGQRVEGLGDAGDRLRARRGRRRRGARRMSARAASVRVRPKSRARISRVRGEASGRGRGRRPRPGSSARPAAARVSSSRRSAIGSLSTSTPSQSKMTRPVRRAGHREVAAAASPRCRRTRARAASAAKASRKAGASAVRAVDVAHGEPGGGVGAGGARPGRLQAVPVRVVGLDDGAGVGACRRSSGTRGRWRARGRRRAGRGRGGRRSRG